MSNNLELWNLLADTDPEYIKPVSFGSRSFTAIDPQYQIRKMTDTFGAIGAGWGWSNVTEVVHFSNGDSAVMAHVTIWHSSESTSFGPFTGCRKLFDSSKGRLAEDAPKMAITDGLTKALSHIGCDANIFLGKMDGNKYAQDAKKSGEPQGEW